MEITQRQADLLQAIVQEYINSARPIGSKTLVHEYGFDYSTATIRNEMAALEAAGLITQPHTSAGRIPTEKGYQFYIQNFLKAKKLAAAKRKQIDTIYEEQQKAIQKAQDAKQIQQQRELVKRAAQTLSEMTGEAVVVSVNGLGTYFTGISHIFRKPEFNEHAQLMLAMSEAFDHIDELMQEVNVRAQRQREAARQVAAQQAQQVQRGVEILLGRENPFSEICSMIISDYALDDKRGTMGILGPMRMDYDTNIAIMEYMEQLMNDDDQT